MIKGVNHTIIEVTNPQNRYFERALLFVRPRLTSVESSQLQRFADHFVQSVGTPPVDTYAVGRRRSRQKRRILYGFWGLVGFVTGVLFAWWL